MGVLWRLCWLWVLLLFWDREWHDLRQRIWILHGEGVFCFSFGLHSFGSAGMTLCLGWQEVLLLV